MGLNGYVFCNEANIEHVAEQTGKDVASLKAALVAAKVSKRYYIMVPMPIADVFTED